MIEIINPRIGELIIVHKRIWHNFHKIQQHLLFQASSHYVKFQLEHDGAMARYHVWNHILAKIGTSGTSVSKPLAESCVDAKKSAMEHMVATLLAMARKK